MATTGNLAEMSIPAIIQSVCLETGTARLMVKSPEGEAAIYCDAGEIVHCRFGQAVGQEALYQVLCWGKGIFRLDVGVPSPARTVQGSWRNHLIQAMVNLDHLRQQQAAGNQARTPPEPVAGPGRTPQPAVPPQRRAAPERQHADSGEAAWIQRVQSIAGVRDLVVVNAEGSSPPYAPAGQREDQAGLVAFIGNAAFQISEGLGLKSLQKVSFTVGGTPRLIFKCGECYLGLQLAAGENVAQVAAETRKILDERKK